MFVNISASLGLLFKFKQFLMYRIMGLNIKITDMGKMLEQTCYLILRK